MSYPVPRRRVLNLLKLRRAALRIFDFAGAVCVLANVCIGGPAWERRGAGITLAGLDESVGAPAGGGRRSGAAVSAFPERVRSGADDRAGLWRELYGIVLPVLLACTLVLLSAVYYLGRRRSLMPLLRLLALAVLDIAAALCGLLPLNLPASITLMALSLAAALPALFLRRSEVMAELKKRLHR